MQGLKFDFDVNDIVIDAGGSFAVTTIDNQNVALIALSQVCRITRPEVGAQIGSRIINRRQRNVDSVLADAKYMAERDGAQNVSVELTDDKLSFKGEYED